MDKLSFHRNAFALVSPPVDRDQFIADLQDAQADRHQVGCIPEAERIRPKSLYELAAISRQAIFFHEPQTEGESESYASEEETLP